MIHLAYVLGFSRYMISAKINKKLKKTYFVSLIYTQMELKVQDPYTVELAHRWFVATFQEFFDCRGKLREKIELDDRYTIMHEKCLNSEIQASYHLSLDSDNKIEIEYIIELFGNSRVSEVIPVFYETCEFIQCASAVRTRIQKFCDKVHYVCKCGQLAKPRLGFLVPNPAPHCVEHRCENCYLYWFKRTDDRCAVCLEDEGVWVKLSCGHILHQHCWGRIKGVQCPVCRVSVESGKSVYKYPYLGESKNKK